MACGTTAFLALLVLIALSGLPTGVVFGALADPEVRGALFSADTDRLHGRLKEMDVDRQIDDYYSERIEDPKERELYTDQVFYNFTGYYNGSEHEATSSGNLIWKEDLPE